MTSPASRRHQGGPALAGARRVRVRARLRARGSEESGVVMVIVAGLLVAILGMAALAIDLSSFYQAQRQAQSAADAGALAGAAALAAGSTTAASAASSTATSYAHTNYPGSSPAVTVNSAATQVTVNVNASAPSFFGQLFGLTNGQVGAKAVAGLPTLTPCTNPGNNCYAIFAMDSTSGSNGVIFNGAGDVIHGGVHSNCGIYLDGGTQTLGPTTYGSGCAVTQGGGGDTFSWGPDAEAAVTSWPDDYSTILGACGGAGQVACTGPGGTPAYCTQAARHYTFGRGADALNTQNVYCAYGTGNVTDPATWNGLIEFQSGSLGSSSAPIQGTWIAGTIDVDHQSYLSTQTTTPSYPLFYAVGSGTCSSATVGGVCMTAADNQLTGAIYAPNGTVQFNGAGSTANFLEGKDVDLIGGTFNGSGPSGGGGGGWSDGITLQQ